MTNNLAKLKSN